MENKATYKVTIRQQLLVLLPFFIFNAIGYVAIARIFRGEAFDGYTLAAYMAVFILQTLPVLILHIQYLLANKSMILEVDKTTQRITVKKKGKSYEYNLSDIVSLDYYSAPGHSSKKGSTVFYSFDNYRFYKIIFKDGKYCFITCLMIKNIEHTLERQIGKEAQWHARALPILR